MFYLVKSTNQINWSQTRDSRGSDNYVDRMHDALLLSRQVIEKWLLHEYIQ